MVGERLKGFSSPFAGMIQAFLIQVGGHHLPQEKIVAAQGQHLPDLALDVDGTFFDKGRPDDLSRKGGKAGRGELVAFPPGKGATEIDFSHQILVGDVNHELARFFDEAVGMAASPDGHSDHGRIKTAEPDGCNRDDIGSRFFPRARDETNGEGIEQGGWVYPPLGHCFASFL
jgi:hypothetical protein